MNIVFQVVFISVHLVFVGMGWFFMAKMIDFDRHQFWKLYRGTPVYIESNDSDIKSWVDENLKEKDFYKLGASSSLLILRDAKDAVLIKLMVE